MVEITDPFYGPPHAFFNGLLASGAGVGGEVIQIGDRWYVPDFGIDRYRIITVPAMRPQEDTSTRPGEGTLSSQGLWRRSPSSWHLGSGQEWFDREDSNPFRYRASRGIDPWTKWQLALLPSTSSVDTNSGGWTSSAVGMFTGGSRLVVAGANGRCVTIEPDGTVNEVTGLTGEVWCASSGAQVYVSDTTGIYPLDAAGTGLGTAFNTNITGAKLWFAKDRLWAADGVDLYNVVDGTTSAPHFTHLWPDWEWTSVSESLAHVYAAGFSGERGQVYAIGIDPDTTTPLPPIVALPLPTTEVPHSVFGYVGLVAVGTNEGLRACQPQQDGTLVSGPVVGTGIDDVPNPVRCIEGVGQYIYFGQDDLYTDSSALGRSNLADQYDTLTPAYAPDMAPGLTGNVTTVRYFDARLWFTVGESLFVQGTDFVSSGFIDTGRITMNVADRKSGVYMDVRHEPLREGESVLAYITAPNRPMAIVGNSDVQGSERPINAFPINPTRQVWHDLRVEMFRGVDASMSPSLTAMTLAAQVAPDRSANLLLPLILSETVTYVDMDFHLDVLTELAYFVDLAFTQRLIRYRQGTLEFQGFVEDFEFVPSQPTQDGKGLNGTVILKFKTAEARR